MAVLSDAGGSTTTFIRMDVIVMVAAHY